MRSTAPALTPVAPPSLGSAALFVAIGLALYLAAYGFSERLVLQTGDTNPFFKIATAETRDVDWLILGASHAMPLDYADFEGVMERATGRTILNLAAPGTGPLYNRFVLEHFLKDGSAANVLYVADSFAFGATTWNEERFADAKLVRRTPFDPAIARRMLGYVRNEGVAATALLDYVTGFSKINNRERFEPDIWEGEAQFERVFRPSRTADRQRIAYLYPDGAGDAATRARYLDVLGGLIATAQAAGARVVVVKFPVPDRFFALLPDEAAFDQALAARARALGADFRDFSRDLSEPRFYSDTDHLNRDGLTTFFEQSLKDLLAGGGE